MAFGNRSVSLRPPFGWYPWQELEDLWRALDRAGTRSVRPADRESGVVAFIPEFDLYDTGASIVIKVDLPGVAPENLDVSAEGDALTISGLREVDYPEDAVCLSCERSVGRFARRIELPKSADLRRVTATLRNGVLEITVPKDQKETIEKVAVRVES